MQNIPKADFSKPRTIDAMPSKSELHRALIASSLCAEPTTLLCRLSSVSDDIAATVEAIRQLGANIEVMPEGGFSVSPTTVLPTEKLSLDCRESGTTLRFLLPFISALGLQATFNGSGRLSQRPINALMEQLSAHGINASSMTLPISISGKLTPGTFTLPGNISSQFISGLLLALPLLDGDSKILLSTPLESASYVDMTIHMLKHFGITATKLDNGWSVSGNQSFKSPGKIDIFGDWSNAAVWLAAGALTGQVTVQHLDIDAPQGDKALLQILETMGAAVTRHGPPDSVTVAHRRLKALSVDIRDIPDLLPVLAVTATAAEGESIFTNAARLRLKESDRLASTAALINSLGGHAVISGDALAVTGTDGLQGGNCQSFNDHRIVMAATLASLISKNQVTIDSLSPISKSYPDFFTLW